MTGLKELRQMALEDSRKKYPTLPEGARYIKPYSDKTANALTRAIIDFLRFSGCQAERIAVTGRYLDHSKVITDVTGFRRRIGSGKWIPGSMQPGTADISATINGRSVKIEIKMKDKQSPAQQKYQAAIERAGGVYLICRSFDEFKQWYDNINLLKNEDNNCK